MCGRLWTRCYSLTAVSGCARHSVKPRRRDAAGAQRRVTDCSHRDGFWRIVLNIFHIKGLYRHLNVIQLCIFMNVQLDECYHLRSNIWTSLEFTAWSFPVLFVCSEGILVQYTPSGMINENTLNLVRLLFEKEFGKKWANYRVTGNVTLILICIETHKRL